MSFLTLTVAELFKVGPITSNHSLCLLPLSKKKRKQKLVIGDENGVVGGYQMKKGEAVNTFKPLSLGSPVSSICMFSSTKGVEDKAFVSFGQSIHAITKKGKECYKFRSNLTEHIMLVRSHETKLWTTTEYTFSEYENGNEKHSFICPDKINDMEVFTLGEAKDHYTILACRDGIIRFIQHSKVIAKKTINSSITAICKMPMSMGVTRGEKADSIDSTSIDFIYGTAVGSLGMIRFNSGGDVTQCWHLPTAIQSDYDMPSTSTINTITCIDLNKDDVHEIVVGRDDGLLEVYGYNPDISQVSEPIKLFEHKSAESIRCVVGGIVSTPGYEEIVACTFSGRVLSFTTEPLDQPDAEDSYGRTRGTVHRETRIQKLRKEVQQLEEKITKEKAKSLSNKGKGYLPVADELVVNNKFQLNPTIGAYDVTLEIPASIKLIVLHSAVPIDLLENDNNTAIVSRSPTDPANNTHFLATYRCHEATNRLEFNIRTIEGQFGDIEATIISDTSPIAAQCIKFYVKPLSLHHRIHILDDNELGTPTNTITFTGSFSLLQIHEWVSICIPDVPTRPQSDEIQMFFRNSYLGYVLICRYRKGEALFSSQSVSVIAILKEVITKEATARKVTLNLNLDIKKESLTQVLTLLKPLLDSKHARTSQAKLIEGLKELELHEDDYRSWMNPQYQQILHDADAIQKEQKAAPKALNYLAGVLTDLYVDYCKFKGTNAKQNMPKLYSLIETYNFDKLVDFFLRE